MVDGDKMHGDPFLHWHFLKYNVPVKKDCVLGMQDGGHAENVLFCEIY